MLHLDKTDRMGVGHPRTDRENGGTMMDIQEFCETAVRESDPANIPDFGYFGDLPFGETWARTFAHCRDSDTLEESNWNVITQDLLERFPDHTTIESYSHWAVGWCESLCVQMLTEDRKPTEAAYAVFEWHKSLEDYPVADEEDYSRAEWESAQETWEWLDMRERIRLCKEAGLSIFAARSEEIPRDDTGYLFEYLTTP